jgi:hypothetical protein
MSNKEKKVSKKKEQEKKPASSNKTIKYIVIANVKENGKFFKIGNEYKGENIESFLKKGYIKKD